ncbi:DUF2793 domain-containing protein [Roseobacter sp. HKCCD9010]|uniref:DUF2793 domain-containing protein n=1 Tax=unclassified Roseobacter TaxID=196798 RepID=UPI001492CECD|nr:MULTISPECIES: DUF2793 domain-containing protein [unclassified Roseobacter]MBF9049934.1 DUF2793 domain-containing protein [Rhodobacterales bacterium HKCCD4356]NNV13527.1 DUF2793 domain-containing protein [Roseobacter sp. HKCCD7357]NNV16360.1 DUF2793 domain-containing protein [Roseobacter sp. HKCCD8768]NNV25820.1 DUF2793 domain-containing protein [Roseobacter sp. HKCCD8192]NNV30076.1 DUF2793 domain-containing protein [Roseobacter sp. HKCCD9061]
MTNTPQLNLPLLSPSQAQKHVTVNEALSRLDGMVQLRLISVTQSTPPVLAEDGDCYGVPIGATDAWSGQVGEIAIYVNNGWDFISPQQGFRAVILDQGVLAMHDGDSWRDGAVTLTQNGAGMALRSVEIDVPIIAGPTVTTPVIFPERSIVFGVTGLVTQALGGATTWRLGVACDAQRYGSGLGVAQNSFVSGPSTPTVYWTPTELLISADGPDFTGGTVRLAAHYAMLSLPNWV